jgi:hypothetical protein
VFGGALVGIALRALLPEQHVNADSKSAVTVAMGLVATLSALVLGLLVGSAKGAYDAQSTAVTNMSAQLIMLDRVLSHYGPETRPMRSDLRAAAVAFLERTWSAKGLPETPHLGHPGGPEVLLDSLQALSPKTDEQRAIRSQAYTMVLGLGQTRWLMYEERATGVSIPMLIILVFWLTAIFVSFGLFAPTNPTVVSAFCVAALSVSAAVLLILEMYKPYSGLIQISSAPLRSALAIMGQ